MKNAYTVLWARHHCARLKKAGEVGRQLEVLFGGVHQSAPSLKRAGIKPGDAVFPVSVYQGSLYLLAGAVIREFVSLDEYAVSQLGLERRAVAGLDEYQLKQLIAEKCGELEHRAPYGCGTEVALVECSTPLRFDVIVPPERLPDIKFCPRKGAPISLRHIEDGKLTSAISLQGNVRRLCSDSAKLFSELVGLSWAS
jgi:hypothetical protein